MRGEHCIAGASVLTFLSMVLLVFTHVGQINPTTLPRGLYWVELNVQAYGAGLQGGTGSGVGGLYDTNNNDKLGSGKGLRQYYRWDMYGACGYQKDGSGRCNATQFAYPFKPLGTLLGDVPSKFLTQTAAIIGTDAGSEPFKNDGNNAALSRGAFWAIFIGSIAVAVAFVAGLVPSRFSFLIASVAVVVGALGTMIGAAIWTSVIAKDSFVNKIHVEHGNALGMVISAGPALYLTWVAFALTALAIVPYCASCLTYRPHKKEKYEDDYGHRLLDRKPQYGY